jgi:glucosamine-6-phosphate deaminase
MSSNASETFLVDSLSVRVYNSEVELALQAATIVRGYLQEILTQKNLATALLATGNSQLKFLQALINLGNVDWSRLILFHLDEYLGIDPEHKGSFCYYLQEKVEKIVNPGQFHYIQGNSLEPILECSRYSNLLMTRSIDLCFLGIGANGHIAFNEPNVANFDDSHPVKIVRLAEETRLAQINSDYFPNIESVPQYAFTVSIPTICSAQKIICLAPGLKKASIVKKMLTQPISTDCPASILRQQAQAILFLDRDSASLL